MLSPRDNAHLGALTDDEFARFVEHLELIQLHKGETLFHPGEIPGYVYYPVNAIVSMMNDMADGYSVETYMLGRASMVGLTNTGNPSFYRALVRSSGWAYRLKRETLDALKAVCPSYVKNNAEVARRVMVKFHNAVACAKRHSVEKQLIRWILTTLDLSNNPTIATTHQELSELLGFRREAITLALGKLTSMGGLLVYRGEIVVTRREVLEEHCCDCYWLGLEKQRHPQPFKLFSIVK